MRLAISVGVIGLLVVGGIWWYHYTGTPQYSLVQLTKAVKAKDYETARFFVDDERMADSISKAFTDAAMNRVTNEITNDRNPFSGLGLAMVQMMVPRLRESVKEQVKDSIKQVLSGNDTLTSKDGTKQVDLKSFSNLRIKQCVTSGNTAEVIVAGLPQPNPLERNELRLRMARIPTTRSWRIVEAPDVAEIINKIVRQP